MLRMREVKDMLDKNEYIIWEGKPTFLPFFVKGIISYTFILTFLYFFLYFMINGVLNLGYMETSSIYIAFFWILPASLITALIYVPFAYRFVYYIVSDRRIIIQGGIIGRDFKSLDYSLIGNINLEAGIIDRVFSSKKTGTLELTTTGNLSTHLQHISDAEKVFTQIKNHVFNVKTDIFYPNALRPDQNPGYRTKFSEQKDK